MLIYYGNVPRNVYLGAHDAQLNTDAKRLEMDNNANIPDGWLGCIGRSYTKTMEVRYTPSLVVNLFVKEKRMNTNRQCQTHRRI